MIDEKHRFSVVKWIWGATRTFHLRRSVAFMAIDLFDRVDTRRTIPSRDDMQRLACSAILIAAKIEDDNNTANAHDLSWISGGAFSEREILEGEMTIATDLDWLLMFDTLYDDRACLVSLMGTMLAELSTLTEFYRSRSVDDVVVALGSIIARKGRPPDTLEGLELLSQIFMVASKLISKNSDFMKSYDPSVVNVFKNMDA